MYVLALSTIAILRFHQIESMTILDTTLFLFQK